MFWSSLPRGPSASLLSCVVASPLRKTSALSTVSSPLYPQARTATSVVLGAREDLDGGLSRTSRRPLRSHPFILYPGRCSLPCSSWKRWMEPSLELAWSCRDDPLLPLGWPPQEGSVYGIVSSHMVCTSWYREISSPGTCQKNMDGKGQRAEGSEAWHCRTSSQLLIRSINMGTIWSKSESTEPFFNCIRWQHRPIDSIHRANEQA